MCFQQCERIGSLRLSQYLTLTELADRQAAAKNTMHFKLLFIARKLLSKMNQ